MCTPYEDLDFSDLGFPIFDDCDPWGDLDMEEV
jgi:hypothetical protein